MFKISFLPEPSGDFHLYHPWILANVLGEFFTMEGFSPLGHGSEARTQLMGPGKEGSKLFWNLFSLVCTITGKSILDRKVLGYLEQCRIYGSFRELDCPSGIVSPTFTEIFRQKHYVAKTRIF